MTPTSFRLLFVHSLSVVLLLTANHQARADFVTFETGPVRPLAVSSDGSELYATNIPDGELEIFDVTAVGLVKTASVQVGLEPCAVAVASDGRVWVVNHLSDSVSIVDLAAGGVVETLATDDEPCDVLFAGTPERAFVSCSQANSILVFDPSRLDGPPDRITIEGETLG